MRMLLAGALLLALAACGEAQLEEAKQGALDLGQSALEAATSALDTRTACTLAGQSEAYCGCLQERLGAELTPERVEAITTVVRDTIEGGGVEAAVEGASGIDAETRDALVQCVVQPESDAAANET
jgi:formylmethanofuran:tetrahydromethanopterin formyltransferase